MKHKGGSVVLVFPFPSGGVLLLACGPNGVSWTFSATLTDANLPDKIQQARTPEQHQKIARYDDAQAQAAARQATEDRDLKRRHESAQAPDDRPAGPATEGHFDSATGTATLTLRGFGPSAEDH